MYRKFNPFPGGRMVIDKVLTLLSICQNSHKEIRLSLVLEGDEVLETHTKVTRLYCMSSEKHCTVADSFSLWNLFRLLEDNNYLRIFPKKRVRTSCSIVLKIFQTFFPLLFGFRTTERPPLVDCTSVSFHSPRWSKTTRPSNLNYMPMFITLSWRQCLVCLWTTHWSCEDSVLFNKRRYKYFIMTILNF